MKTTNYHKTLCLALSPVSYQWNCCWDSLRDSSVFSHDKVIFIIAFHPNSLTFATYKLIFLSFPTLFIITFLLSFSLSSFLQFYHVCYLVSFLSYPLPFTLLLFLSFSTLLFLSLSFRFHPLAIILSFPFFLFTLFFYPLPFLFLSPLFFLIFYPFFFFTLFLFSTLSFLFSPFLFNLLPFLSFPPSFYLLPFLFFSPPFSF